MKIDSNELKAQYQAYVESQKPISRKECPSTKKLLRLLRSRSSEKQATKIVDHISHCSYCAREFKFLVEVIRNENVLLQDIEQLLSSRQANESQKNDDLKTYDSRMARRYFFSRFSWRTALLITSFIIVGFIISSRILFRTDEKYRTDHIAGVELLQPVDEKISKTSLMFEWKDVKSSQYYILELFDKALVPIWKSDKIFKNSAVLPPELATKLQINSSYFWMITALISNGEQIKSRMAEFVIKE